MPAERVIASRTNLIRAKEDLALATEGHRLLDQKREALIIELLQLLTRLREQAKVARTALAEGYASLDEAEIAVGAKGLEDASFGPLEPPEVSAVDRSVMGVAIPSLGVEREGRGPEVPLAGTVPELEEAAAEIREAVPKLLRWAELHLAVYRLGAEVKKTQRRVNALGEVFIPETAQRIATITSALEEAEREEFFRRKRVKNNLRARAGQRRASGT